MKKNKPVIYVISILACLLFIVVLLRLTVFRKTGNVRAKVVTPVVSGQNENDTADTSVSGDSVMQTSFIPLLSTETLMSTLTMDFDGDSLDDQIVAVHKAGSSNLYLIVGLYNSETNSYDRAGEIKTEISKSRTFSFNAIDMIGDHRNALVYQGVNNAGDSVMKIFLCRHRRGVVEILNIGDFSSDGTIFIVQTERSEAYELSQARGTSFSVWVYSSDKEDQNTSTASVSQIQTEYSWDEEARKYTQLRQLRVTGSRLAARELARIQNGNVDTFAQYLNGLWYKTTSNGSTPLYIYFNYEDKEVIFLSDDTEGVYAWEDSSLRRSGIYLTVVNSIIASMKRRFDIMLTGVNEVAVHVHDNVGMVVKESSQWDGTYKKMSFQSTFGDNKKVLPSDEFVKALSENPAWTDDDGNSYTFTENSYKLVNSDVEDKGIFVIDSVGTYPVIQFRGKNTGSALNPAYAMKFKTTEEIIPAKKRGQKPTVRTTVDKNVIILAPVKLSANTCYADEGKRITLSKVKK